MAQTSLKFLPMQSIDAATIGAAYQAFTAAVPFAEACFKVTVTNASNTPVVISLDGINDTFVVGAGLFYDLALKPGNRLVSNEVLIAKGTVPMIKGTAGVGFIYLSAYYV
jgi:hypothetical protein